MKVYEMSILMHVANSKDVTLFNTGVYAPAWITETGCFIS